MFERDGADSEAGNMKIGTTTASLSSWRNGTNIDARRLVNIVDDHWDCVSSPDLAIAVNRSSQRPTVQRSVGPDLYQ